MRHLDLFSGIGGFALAAKWAGFETVGFCEQDDFCKSVLAARWPGVPIHHDVRELDGRLFRGVELISGGYPCHITDPTYLRALNLASMQHLFMPI